MTATAIDSQELEIVRAVALPMSHCFDQQAGIAGAATSITIRRNEPRQEIENARHGCSCGSVSGTGVVDRLFA
jgi:hypothetical protein